MGASFEARHVFTDRGIRESQIIKGNGGYNMGFLESLNSLVIITSYLPRGLKKSKEGLDTKPSKFFDNSLMRKSLDPS